MIVLKEMGWSNAFSYGQDNSIKFDTSSLIQLLGKNGHGKTSILLLLEEVLYNKNSKGIKKSDILNRYIKDKFYSIYLDFNKDNDKYSIVTVRGTTQTVKLVKNGVDVSSHTSTGTYKLIEEIIGFDHKTFTQIVGQSSASSLEFLTATDTNRKKFLIDLLNLGIYTRASEVFKEVLKDANNEAEVINISIKTISDWLVKFGKEDLTIKNLIVVPEPPTVELALAAELSHKIKNISDTNRKITNNNAYKKILEGLVVTPVDKPSEDIDLLKSEISRLNNILSVAQGLVKGSSNIKNTCSSCGQSIDNSHKLKIVEEAKQTVEITNKLLLPLKEKLTLLVSQTANFDSYVRNQQEFEKYYMLIDKTLDSQPLDRDSLENELVHINTHINVVNKAISAAQKYNSEVSAHNAKVLVISGQMDTMRKDLASHTSKYNTISDRISNIQILVKTFSTTGLVAYKIECLVKDLEKLTNEYLLDMSDGRFQLGFKVNSTDKLNVVVTDNGIDIDIFALSTGERARVNIATLLAIRKLMQSISNSKINLLILDETIESLDSEGKEKLIEVLLNEESLNTILVSHGFSHPLLEKISVVKTDNISRIE